MGCHFLLQGIFPAQGLNLGLPHCERTPYHLSHQESLVLMGQPQMLCLLSPGSLGYESRVYFPSVAESHGHSGEENRPRIRSSPPPSSSCSASIMITTASRAGRQRTPSRCRCRLYMAPSRCFQRSKETDPSSPASTSERDVLLLPFTDEEMRTQKSRLTSLRSHSWK